MRYLSEEERKIKDRREEERGEWWAQRFALSRNQNIFERDNPDCAHPYSWLLEHLMPLLQTAQDVQKAAGLSETPVVGSAQLEGKTVPVCSISKEAVDELIQYLLRAGEYSVYNERVYLNGQTRVGWVSCSTENELEEELEEQERERTRREGQEGEG